MHAGTREACKTRGVAESFLSFVKSFNQIPTQRKQLYECFFEFYRLALPVFLFVFNLFFSPLFSRCLFLHYIIICIQKLQKFTLLSHSQETGDKKKRALWCYNARSGTNHIADFLLLIL